MHHNIEKCEACRVNPVQLVDPSDDEKQPYKLCQNCHDRLVKRSLRPIEWFNLAVIHSPCKFYLHDDFYDEDGEACQPEEDLTITEDQLAPSLADVCHDLEAMLDYSITRWFLEEDAILALKKHDADTTLAATISRFNSSTNIEVKSRMLEIAADVLESAAREWVRELWLNYDEELLASLAWATAGSLSAEEGLPLVLEKLELIEDKKRPIYAFTCLHRFRSSAVLDWMELNCTSFHDNWGRLAALCYPTWSRMKSWLVHGRPLSLIALETMSRCVIRGGDPYVERNNPSILETNVDEVEIVLNACYQMDSVARVRLKVAYILDNKEHIFS